MLPSNLSLIPSYILYSSPALRMQPLLENYSEGVTEISMPLLVGVLLVSAVESTGTRTLASGK